MRARVLFDEAHSEAWTIRPELAATMQPSHPGDSSYARAAELLARRDFAVAAHAEGPLDAAALAAADVLVIAHPSEDRWEATTGTGSPRLDDSELDAIEEWVQAGGGLVLLAETEQEKYGSNLDALAARFGIRIRNATVQDYERNEAAPSWVVADLPAGARGAEADLRARVDEAVFYRAGVLELTNGARPVARASETSSHPRATMAAATHAGAGRVAVLADSDLFGDDCIDAHDHAELWLNLLYWTAARAWASDSDPAPSPVVADPHWIALRDQVEALRTHQRPDGSIDLEAHDRSELDAHVAAIDAALAALAPHFAHQADHLAATRADLGAWASGGYGIPDFSDSLDLFRPDLHRVDGIEHLVLFPMYKQNGPREKVFEALVVSVPWPEWLAELEAARYDNPKFVPVHFVDHTSGYDSDSAVLFPETVTASRTANHFGAIFCDREAARLRRTMARAADVVRLNLPPDAAAMLTSPELSQDAFVLWDLVHDRAHSRGDLPFDPFMIRQRAPYWMYGLEELRCDLTAFGEAMRLEEEGLPQARHVQYAILFDRLFRFPITGPRVRNYDGLGGQLLFAYLHRHGHIAWTDNELTVDWHTVAAGVAGLREEVEELYRSGIDRSKLAHWAAAHDLVARYVAPATDSRWVAARREFADVEDPRPYIDEVRPDEFPLSIFYVSLKRKLESDPAPVAA